MKKYYFTHAQPIWLKGREEEKNLHVSFKSVIYNKQSTTLQLTGSTIYRIFVNGHFVAIGPARTAVGYFKVDSFELTPYLVSGSNVLVIEVVGYNVNSYYTLDQRSFLTAEVIQNNEVIAFTGSYNFTCQVFEERVQKVQRYSFQRPFVEIYRMTQATYEYRKNPIISEHFDNEIQFEIVEPKNYIERGIRYPEYEILMPNDIISSGTADFSFICEKAFEDRSYINIGKSLKGYIKESLDEHLSTELQNISYKKKDTPSLRQPCYDEKDNTYHTFAFPYNATGMIAFEVICVEPTVIYGLFDEIIMNDDVDTTRLECCNGVKVAMDVGAHAFISFEPYTMKYLKLIASKACTIKNVRLIEYKHPSVSCSVDLPQERYKLQKIYDAALETYLANSVDTFSDCPSRERAGWLCDSFFTARVEKCLTRESILERSFLENFIIAKDFPCLPEGMLPMCYPADHNDGIFIPNWAMWFVLELEEYFERTGDSGFIAIAKERVYGLLNYFKPFVNHLGLLENLESWVFVEWSKAADYVQDINYPSNMIYARMLQAVGHLYHDEKCRVQSEQVKETIRLRSYNGLFFTDNEVMKNGKLINPNNTTEVCQYYAFFTGVATPECYSDLWQILLTRFGPQRKQNNHYPEVQFANVFIGNYLRLELLFRYGFTEQLLEEVENYFYDMALRSGTLWEHDAPHASCNHGFASHIIYWLEGIYGTEHKSKKCDM